VKQVLLDLNVVLDVILERHPTPKRLHVCRPPSKRDKGRGTYPPTA
jgi:hypothetical protein